MRPTTKDLAKAAGVSLATVDRVLNGRSGVRAKTVEAVNAAIEEIGFSRNVSAANLARGRSYRFRFLLPRTADQFIQVVKDRIGEAAVDLAKDGVDVDHRDISTNDPHQIAKQLLAIDPAKIDGVALMAPDSPQVRDSIIRLRKSGTQVMQFVSGQAADGERNFVGIDNAAAGATAARLIGRFHRGTSGKILIVADTMNARDSLERRRGFDTLLGKDYAHLVALPSLETYGNPARTRTIIANAVRNNQDISAVYLMASEARAPLDALAAAADPTAMVVVAHERTARTESGLNTGEIDAVIAQNAGHLVRSAVRQMRARCDGRDIVQSQEEIRIEILLRENL